MAVITQWDRRFLGLAQHIAAWSKDPSTQCGAVIVDPERRIVSTGYNGIARGVLDLPARLNDRATKYDFIIHAEENALLDARQPLDRCTLYVVPLPPCARCAAKIIQVGIKRIVSAVPPAEAAARWGSQWSDADKMYVEAGVQVVISVGLAATLKQDGRHWICTGNT